MCIINSSSSFIILGIILSGCARVDNNQNVSGEAKVVVEIRNTAVERCQQDIRFNTKEEVMQCMQEANKIAVELGDSELSAAIGKEIVNLQNKE